jgi:hypothetical protein
MVVSIFGANKVHLVNGTTFRASIMFMGLVQRKPDSVVRFGRVAYE